MKVSFGINNEKQKKLSIMSFSLFFAWILALPFEGQLLYSLVENVNIAPSKYIFISIAAHFVGLFLCGFFVKKQETAKIVMIISVLICVSGTLVFFLPFSILWYIALIVMSFTAGFFVASWGFYFKNYTYSSNRHKTAADVLIYSNIIMIVVNVITVNVSIEMGLVVSLVLLFATLATTVKLEASLDKKTHYKAPKTINKNSPGILQSFVLLCIFIFVITINSGFMYQVVTPAYGNYEVLASYYWAIPYILALLILRNLPDKIRKAYILYVAMAMIGLSYIAFMRLDNSVTSYLIIDTLMLGAFGVCDMFWWSIIGSFFEYSKTPSKVFGIGLSMNVLGVLIGGLIGNKFFFSQGDYTNASIIALIIIFLVMMLLPILNLQLERLFRSHVFLVKFAKLVEKEQVETVKTFQFSAQLTEKEKEVVKLLLQGYTYKGMAEHLFITENTMKFHIKNIYQKLNINSKMELIKLLSETH